MKNVEVTIEPTVQGPVLVKMVLFSYLPGTSVVDPNSRHIHRTSFDLSMPDEVVDMHIDAVNGHLTQLGGVVLSQQAVDAIKLEFGKQLARLGRPPLPEA